MNKHLIAALGSLMFAAAPAASLAAAQLPKHTVPAGFHAVEGRAGGRLLAGTLKGPFSTPGDALAATLHRLRAYFTGPLPVSSAAEGSSGIVVFFSGHLDRTAVVGMTVIAPAAGRGAAVASIFDTPQRAAKSLPQFASTGGSAHSRSAPAAPAPPDGITLNRQSFADGSGSIGVPEGWRMLGGGRGMVDLVNADGAQAHIAIQFPIWDPRAGLADPTRMQLPFIYDPLQAMIAVTKRVFSTQNKVAPAIDILDVHAVNPPMGAGRAALVHGRTQGAQPVEFVTLSNSAPMSGYAWMFYATTLQAPPQHFARDYPVMLAIWKSYRADAAYERSLAADTANTLSEAAEIVDAGTQRSIVAQEQSSAGVDNIINGNEILETTSDGAHWLGNADAARTLAQKYPETYRIVPVDQYRSGDY
jgi:hypothetical protein